VGFESVFPLGTDNFDFPCSAGEILAANFGFGIHHRVHSVRVAPSHAVVVLAGRRLQLEACW
jgi:hypothetical protein